MNKDLLIRQTFLVAKTYHTFANKRYNKLKFHLFNGIYGEWEASTYVQLQDLLFNLITGEPSFDRFSDRFDSPYGDKGKKPVTWEDGFIPDQISNVIWSDDSAEEKVQAVNKLYAKCIKIEKQFKRKQK